MFFRFTSALILAVLISLIGIALEKQTLERKRTVGRQHYQLDVLMEMHAQSRLKIQQLTAPGRDGIAASQTRRQIFQIPVPSIQRRPVDPSMEPQAPAHAEDGDVADADDTIRQPVNTAATGPANRRSILNGRWNSQRVSGDPQPQMRQPAPLPLLRWQYPAPEIPD